MKKGAAVLKWSCLNGRSLIVAPEWSIQNHFVLVSGQSSPSNWSEGATISQGGGANGLCKSIHDRKSTIMLHHCQFPWLEIAFFRVYPVASLRRFPDILIANGDCCDNICCMLFADSY